MGSFVLEKGPVVRRVILLGLVGVLPLLFFRGAMDPFNVPKFSVLVFAVALVAAIKIFELLQGADPSPLGRLWIPAVALIGPLLLAWIASPYKEFALFGRQGRLQGLIPYLIVVLFGILLADAFTDSPRPIMWAFALAGGGVGAYSLIQYLQADPFGWVLDQERTLTAVSTLGNPNFTGGFLGMTLPLAVCLWLLTPRHRKPLGFMILVIVGALVFTSSQGGWAAAAAGVCIFGGFLLARRTRNGRRWGYLAAGLVVLVTVGVVVAGQLGVPGIPGTATARGNWWRAALAMSVESPVVGRGPSGFAVDGIRYRVLHEAVVAAYTFPDDPHSVPLAFLAAAGIIGLAGFGVVVWWALREGSRLRDDDLEGAAFFALIVAYGTQALVSIDEVILRMSLWIGLAGLVSARLAVRAEKKPAKKQTRAAKPSRSPHKRQPLRWAPALLPLAALVVFAGWWSGAFLVADVHQHEGLEAFGNQDVAAGADHMQKSTEFRFEPGYQRTFALQLTEAAVASNDEELFEAADAEYRELSGWPDVGAYVQRARLMQAWALIDPSKKDMVLDLYRQAIAIDDRNPTLLVEVAAAYLSADEPDEAVALLEPVRHAIGERMPEYWGTLSLALAQNGDERSARIALERALDLDPENSQAIEARDLLS